MSMTDLELIGLTKTYGSGAAVDNLNLSVAAGELVAFLGPSGCGKTTTLRMVAGFVEPTGGTIRVQGRDITGLAPNKRDMGMVFQSYALFPHMTVARNIAFGLHARRVGRSEVAPRVAAALDLVGLSGMEDRYPRQLSGGQQQRVALARVLALRPKLLLFDEPLSNLDAKLRVQMRHEIRRLQKEVGITALFVTHDQEEAMDLADQIVVMSHGQVEQVGGARELYDNPANEFVMTFVGEVNQLGRSFVRPHDVEFGEGDEALVERIVHLGFEVRVELRLANGEELWAQVTREEAQRLELTEGARVRVRPKHAKVFG